MKKPNLSTLIAAFLVFTIITLANSKKAFASWYLDEYGRLSIIEGIVLGDDDEEDEEDSSDDSSGSSSEDEEDEEDEDDDSSEDSDDDDDDDGNEFEYEYTLGGVKYKIERRGSQLQIKREAEGEQNIEYESEGIFEIDQNRVQTRIKVSTGSGEFVYFTRGNSAAKTDFPLSVNAETNELIVTTPNGTKVVTILPDEAVANMLAQNILDNIDEPEGDELPDEDVGEVEESLELEDREGELVYTIDGTSDEKALGIFDVKIKKKAVVSAETGELLEVERTFLQRLLDLISV